MTTLQYSENYLVTTTYPGSTGVTNKDHQKWKIAENKIFSVIFIFAAITKNGKFKQSAV